MQAEPKTNMKVGCWKVGEEQVAEEATVAKLGMTGDKNTKQVRQCIDCVHKHSVLSKFPYLNQIEPAAVRANFKRSVQDVNI